MFRDSAWLAVGLYLLLTMGRVDAQLNIWQIGGSGPEWSESDTLDILIDFETVSTAIQPIYLTADRTVFSHISEFSDYRTPRALGYVNGEWPRSWRNSGGNVSEGYRGSYLVDGDSTTYNPPTSGYGVLEWYTIDLAVPVPANRFGFYTPSQGFRSDGFSLQKDAVPAYEVSIAPDAIPLWVESGDQPRIGTVIADVQENFNTNVRIDFPRQYVRFIRYKRQASTEDQRSVVIEELGGGEAVKGTVADFELFGEGIPRRALYTTRILDLGQELNFGRLFWTATSLRMVDGEVTVAPQADVSLELAVRTGRNDDPNVYHEFTDKGLERVVLRKRFESELKPPAITGAGTQEGKPGLRASIGYDTENWTYWSPPFVQSGQPLGLQSGSHLQIKTILRSEEFDAWLRLDSLWIETAPLLASQVIGEVARLDDPQPARGFTEVELGQTTDFVYEMRAVFSGPGERGFDAIRIHTEQPARFKQLEIGQPPESVDPQKVREEEDGLVIFLPQKITSSRNVPVRVIFDTELFVFAATFAGEVFDTTTESLPQPVKAGDATDVIATNSLRVLGAADNPPEPIQGLAFSTPVLTPNGDGVNDQIEITYSLFRLPEGVPARLDIYTLDGRRVASISAGEQTSGFQRLLWDGCTTEGKLLPPGIYLVDITLQPESSSFHQMRPLGIAY